MRDSYARELANHVDVNFSMITWSGNEYIQTLVGSEIPFYDHFSEGDDIWYDSTITYISRELQRSGGWKLEDVKACMEYHEFVVEITGICMEINAFGRKLKIGSLKRDLEFDYSGDLKRNCEVIRTALYRAKAKLKILN